MTDTLTPEAGRALWAEWDAMIEAYRSIRVFLSQPKTNRRLRDAIIEMTMGRQSDASRRLVAAGNAGALAPAIVLRHPDWFPPEVVQRAQQRMSSIEAGQLANRKKPPA